MKFLKFSDDDVCKIEDWIPLGEYNPHNVRPWLIHDYGFIVAVCFASCESDALDIACDCDKMERYLVTEDSPEWKDYDNPYEELCALGNAGELHDLDTVGIIELPNVKASFVAQFLVEHSFKD